MNAGSIDIVHITPRRVGLWSAARYSGSIGGASILRGSTLYPDRSIDRWFKLEAAVNAGIDRDTCMYLPRV